MLQMHSDFISIKFIYMWIASLASKDPISNITDFFDSFGSMLHNPIQRFS